MTFNGSLEQSGKKKKKYYSMSQSIHSSILKVTSHFIFSLKTTFILILCDNFESYFTERIEAIRGFFPYFLPITPSHPSAFVSRHFDLFPFQ